MSSWDEDEAIAEPAAPAREDMVSVTWWVKIAPKRETPNEPPMVRKRVEDEEPTPMSFISTLFCAISMVICIRKPMPAPSTAMNRPEVKRVVPVSMVDSRYSPTVIRPPPMIGKTLYRPVWVVTRPAISETTIIDSSIGRSSSPELVAEAPCTICWNSGRKVIDPNITKPTRKPTSEISEKLRLRKMCSGSTGSAARVSTYRKTASEATPSTPSPMIWPDPQSYWLPPQVVRSTREVMPVVSSAAPR